MTYVQRENGVIIGVYRNLQEGFAEEELADNNPEVVAFLNPPPPPVESVSARQFKLQLLSMGLLDDVEAWVTAQSKAVQIAFEYSGTFVRNDPVMQQGFADMGFTDEQVVAFFQAASEL